MNVKTKTLPVFGVCRFRNSEFGFYKAAYLMTEALVYIGVSFLLLGVGYAVMYRCVNNSIALRRNAEDIARTLRAGEQWRADVRSATSPGRWETTDTGRILRLPGKRA